VTGRARPRGASGEERETLARGLEIDVAQHLLQRGVDFVEDEDLLPPVLAGEWLADEFLDLDQRFEEEQQGGGNILLGFLLIRAPEQVDEFLAEVVRPLLAATRRRGRAEAKINV